MSTSSDLSPKAIEKARQRRAIHWLKNQLQQPQAKRWYRLTLVLAVARQVMFLLQAWFLSVWVAGFLNHAWSDDVPLNVWNENVFYWLLAVGLMLMLQWGQSRAAQRIFSPLLPLMQQQLFDHAQHLGRAGFQDLSPSELSQLAVEDLLQCEDYYQQYVPQVALMGLLPLLTLVVVASVSWLLALVFLLALIVTPVLMALVGINAQVRNQRNFDDLARLGRAFADAIRALPHLKLLGQSKAQSHTIRQSAEDYRRSTMQVLRVAFLTSASLELISSLTLIVTAVVIGFALAGHPVGFWQTEVSVALGVFLLMVTPDFFQTLRQFSATYHAKSSAMTVAQRVLDFVDRVPKAVIGRDVSPDVTDTSCAVLSAQHLTFAYADRVVLNDVSVVIEPGQMVAITGASGTGKSTLMQLLMGNLQPQGGDVSFAGHSLTDWNMDAYRRQWTWVGQTPQVFYGTLRENLQLASPDHVLSDAECLTALTFAQLEDWYQKLPQGLATPLGESGMRLSGGQRQRLALARAYLQRASLWFLDEPTASLDADTAQQVRLALQTVQWHNDQGKTVKPTLVLITHDATLTNLCTQHIHLPGEGDAHD